MAGNKPYNDDVYKRLELVRKQFKNNAEQQKKQETAERRKQRFSSIVLNRTRIVRITTYVVLGLLVVAVIAVAVYGAIAG
jgi:uncharacterized membrane protein